jgi:hypothetical protein
MKTIFSISLLTLVALITFNYQNYRAAPNFSNNVTFTEVIKKSDDGPTVKLPLTYFSKVLTTIVPLDVDTNCAVIEVVDDYLSYPPHLRPHLALPPPFFA